MGFIINLIKAVILVFAVIGFMSIGGNDFITQKWNEFMNPPQDIMLEKAKKVGDFSKIPDEYELDKAATLLGYSGVLAEHRASGQKLIVVDAGKKPILTPDDFEENKIEEKLNETSKKFKYKVINVQNIKITKKGTINSFGKDIKYAKFNAKISKLPNGEAEGIISAIDLGNGQSRLLVSVNEKGKYSQIIAQNFFKNVKE
ncbi:MAG: hypothetical protein MJ229_00870 [bacterium]|nr:hypothetical protein [bacterium]